MTEEFENTGDAQKGQNSTTDSVNLRKDCADVRAGARQEDQLEKLHPGDDPELKNNINSLGNPPNKHVDNGSPDEHEYPKNEQKWPENKVPTK